MKIRYPSLLCAGVAVALSYSFAPSEVPSGTATPSELRQQERPSREAPAAATKDSPDAAGWFRTSYLEGSRVENREGRRLGRVKDFALDLTSGELVYILVDAGFLRLPTDPRPVPVEAVTIRTDRRHTSFVLDIEPKRWKDGAPTLARDEFTHLQDPAVAEDIHRFYGLEVTPPERLYGAPDRSEGPMAESTLERASQLTDRRVVNQQEQRLGHMDDFLVNVDEGRVLFVLIAPDRSLSHPSRFEFAVAPQSLAFRPRSQHKEPAVILDVTEKQLAEARLLDDHTLRQEAERLARDGWQEAHQRPQVFRVQRRPAPEQWEDPGSPYYWGPLMEEEDQ
jgi:sporulation protein YlmC with PRC-barrel domain